MQDAEVPYLIDELPTAGFLPCYSFTMKNIGYVTSHWRSSPEPGAQRMKASGYANSFRNSNLFASVGVWNSCCLQKDKFAKNL